MAQAEQVLEYYLRLQDLRQQANLTVVPLHDFLAVPPEASSLPVTILVHHDLQQNHSRLYEFIDKELLDDPDRDKRDAIGDLEGTLITTQQKLL